MKLRFSIRDLFRRIQFRLFGRRLMNGRKVFHLNASGPFYVEDSLCVCCEAPEHEAPELMSHDAGDYNHCYFQRQPQTFEETEKAICAVLVGCCGAVRYGGTDKAIIDKLVAAGAGDNCDNA